MTFPLIDFDNFERPLFDIYFIPIAIFDNGMATSRNKIAGAILNIRFLVSFDYSVAMSDDRGETTSDDPGVVTSDDRGTVANFELGAVVSLDRGAAANESGAIQNFVVAIGVNVCIV